MALTEIKTSGIADDAVTTDKLANAINTARDANTAKATNATHTGDVTGSGSLTIADNAVTLAKMASGTDGQIITYDASGDPVAVGPGTDGQVLTSTGAGSPPAFETLPTSGAALTGSTNNTITTVTGANAIQGEANLTFDGTSLDFPTNNTWITGGGHSVLQVDATMSYFYGGSGGAQFRKADNSAPLIEVSDSGNLEITDGDLVIGTSGHGIDFSATADGGGTTSNELLADYEQGSWTPVFQNGSGSISGVSYNLQVGKYTKIGNVVYVQGLLRTTAVTVDSSGTYDIGGLPFTSGATSALGSVHCYLQSAWDKAPHSFDITASATSMRARQGIDVGDTGYTTASTTDFNETAGSKNRIYFNGAYLAAA